MSSSRDEIPITLIKDYYWCPLKAYYQATLWNPPPTQSMQTGTETQSMHRSILVEILEKRHKIHEYLWEHPVESKRLGLRGRIDLVATTTSQRIIIVDIKLYTGDAKRLITRDKHIAAQLAAYAIAAEETLHHSLEAAYIYSIEREKLYQVPITPRLRRLVEHAAKNIHKALETNKPPPPMPSKRRCNTCRYKTICPFARTT